MQESILSRRQILQGAATVAAASLLPGCSSSSTPGTSTSTSNNINPQPNPGSPLTTVSVTVSATASGTIGPEFIGLSYDKLSISEPEWTPTNTNMIAMFKRLGVAVLRLGSGSNSVWTPNGAGGVSTQVAPKDVQNLAGFLQATNCKCIYGINMAGAYPGYTNGALATTTTLGAEEIAYAYSQIGSLMLGAEIGNEPDNYGYVGGLLQGDTWNLGLFQTLWGQFHTAIVGSTPTAAFTGPATGADETTWTVPFAEYEGKNLLSLMTQHYYRGPATNPTPTVAQLILPDTTLTTYLSELAAGSATAGMPFRISECNSYYGGGATGVSDAYASALWVIDFMFNCAQGGSTGVTFHSGFNLNYTVIADNNGTVIGARPIYYGIMMFGMAGQGTLYSTTVSAGTLNVTAYAVKTSTGLNVVIVNKDSTQNIEVLLSLPQIANTANVMEMTQATSGVQGPSLAALSGVTIQGAVVNADGMFSPNAAYTLATGSSHLTCYVPYLSAIVVQIT